VIAGELCALKTPYWLQRLILPPSADRLVRMLSVLILVLSFAKTAAPLSSVAIATGSSGFLIITA
jgi:hypothetical protein